MGSALAEPLRLRCAWRCFGGGQHATMTTWLRSRSDGTWPTGWGRFRLRPQALRLLGNVGTPLGESELCRCLEALRSVSLETRHCARAHRCILCGGESAQRQEGNGRSDAVRLRVRGFFEGCIRRREGDRAPSKLACAGSRSLKVFGPHDWMQDATSLWRSVRSKPARW